MNTLKNHLEHREKAELIAIIQHMLLQEPDLQWLLATPLPTASSLKTSIDPKIYQQQIVAAMSASDNQRKRKRGEVQRRLAVIKSIADEFAANKNYAEALTIYEVLVNEIIAHFNDYRDEYVAFSVILMRCIDGLDSCFAGEEDNPQMRLRVIRALFTIYRFYTDSAMDKTSPEERQVIAGWVHDALKQKSTWSNGERYEILLAALKRANEL